MGRYLATSVAFRLLFMIFAFCLSDSGLAGNCVGCGGRGRVFQSAPVFMNQRPAPVFMSGPSSCGGRPCGAVMSSMPSACGGRVPCGQSFSVGQPSNCGGLGNCGGRVISSSSPCGGGRGCGASQGASSGGGNCRYGENQNILICSDGISDRGPDGIFRLRANQNVPATQVAPGNVGGVQPAPAFGLKGPVASSGSHTEAGPGVNPSNQPSVDAQPKTAAGPTTSSRSEDPKAAPRKLPAFRGEYFRFGLPEDNFAGNIGRCSSTGALVEGIDLSGVGTPATGGEWCPTVTAAHCVEDSLGPEMLRILKDRKLGQSCNGKNALGFKTKINTTFPGSPTTEAVILFPENTKSDLTVMLVPCTSDLKKFPLAKGIAPLAVQTYLPMSQGGLDRPAVIQARNLTVPYLNGFATTANPQVGEFTFAAGPQARSGDSGSPAFVTVNNVRTLAGVVHGVSSGGLMGGTLITAGLTLEPNGPNAVCNLDRDVKKILDGVKCEEAAQEVKPRKESKKELSLVPTKESSFTADSLLPPVAGEESLADWMTKQGFEAAWLNKVPQDRKLTRAQAATGMKLVPSEIGLNQFNLGEGPGKTALACQNSEVCSIRLKGGDYLYFPHNAKVPEPEEEPIAEPKAKAAEVKPPVAQELPDPTNLAEFEKLRASSTKPVFLILTNTVTCVRCKSPTFQKDMAEFQKSKPGYRFVVIDMSKDQKIPGYKEINNRYVDNVGWPTGVKFTSQYPNGMTYPADGSADTVTIGRLFSAK